MGGDLRTRGSKTIAFPTWLGIVHSIHLCHLWKGLCFLHCILSSCLLNLPDHRLIGNIPTFSSKVLRAQTQFCEVRRPNSLACGSTGSLAHFRSRSNANSDASRRSVNMFFLQWLKPLHGKVPGSHSFLESRYQIKTLLGP